MKRFWDKVDKTADCWLWTAAINKQGGYGCFWFNGKQCRANRISWELHYGKIPNEIHVLHKCDQPLCVRPSHLFLGTHQDNMKDRNLKGRSKSGRQILTPEDVKTIIEWSTCNLQTDLAQAFGVSQGQISRIVNHKSW